MPLGQCPGNRGRYWLAPGLGRGDGPARRGKVAYSAPDAPAPDAAPGSFLVGPPQGGAGAEVQALLTARLGEAALLHLNGGGVYDARPAEAEKGWRASALGEAPLGTWRPGLELFTRRFEGRDMEALAGAGSIIGLGPLDLRLGVHAGLTAAAPDLVLNLWIASKVRTR